MEQQLRRDLGLTEALFTVIGTVIGSGIFALPAVVFTAARAPGLGIAAWVLGGLISLAAGLTVAELSAAMPRAGGTYVFLREAYGEWMGFLQGWATFLAYNSAMMAALSMLFTSYLTVFVPLTATGQKLVGLLSIIVLTAVNALGVRFGGFIQVVATVGKLIPIFLLIIFGAGQVDAARLTPFLPQGPEGASLATALAGAVLPVLWAYDGWILVGQLAEEVRHPHRSIPLALIGGIAVVTVIYSAFNWVLAGVVPMNVLTASERPVVPLAQQLFGTAGSRLITAGMLVSMFGTLNAVVMTAPRYYLAMARDGLFPSARLMATLHPRHQTPVTALLVSAAWATVLLLSGRFGQLLNLVVLVAWVFYLLTMVAVIILRRTRPEMPRPYRVWGYPVVPLIGISAALWIVLSSFTTDIRTALIGMALTATGFPAYWLIKRRT